jgi:hypothetical protein
MELEIFGYPHNSYIILGGPRIELQVSNYCKGVC